MTPLLARLPGRRAVGIALGARQVAASLVAFTPLGPREVERQAQPVTGDEPPAAALRRLVAAIAARRGWRRAPLAVGLPPRGLFFTTRPLKASAPGEDASPRMLLHEVLQSPSLIVDDMEVDLIAAQPCRQPIVSLAACHKQTLAPVLAALERCEVRPTRVEPGFCGLLRAGRAAARAPRRARIVLRVFLGAEAAVALLTADGLPLLCREFLAPPGAEAAAILAEYRAAGSLCRLCGVEAAIDAVVVHGRPDLAALAAAREWAALPQPTRCAGPGHEPAAVAFGVALGCRDPDAPAFNLARAAAPAPTVARLVPWAQLAAEVGLLAGATLLMAQALGDLERSRAAVRRELAGFAAAAQPPARLRDDRKAAAGRVEAVGRYLESRIVWTGCLREVAGGLPAGLAATRIEGENAYEAKPGARGRQRRALRITAEAPAAEGATPPEVAQFLDALRGARALRRVLPAVRMAGLRWSPPTTSRPATAAFTIVCAPEPATPKAPRK